MVIGNVLELGQLDVFAPLGSRSSIWVTSTSNGKRIVLCRRGSGGRLPSANWIRGSETRELNSIDNDGGEDGDDNDDVGNDGVGEGDRIDIEKGERGKKWRKRRENEKGWEQMP